MVACPQNGTSHSGEKYRTRHASPSGAAKAVSENPTSAAIACIFDAGGKSSPIQIPAGLPPLLPSENAAMRRTVMLVILMSSTTVVMGPGVRRDDDGGLYLRR